MASIDDILKRGGISRSTQGTDVLTSPNRAGAGANAQAIPGLIRDTREYNVQKEIEKVDHDNPLLTTANLETSNPLISIPANTINLGGRILSNMGQGIGNAEAMYHEVRAATLEGTLPQEVFDMQSNVDRAEGEIAALNEKLVSGKAGSLQEHMKLIGEISSKSAELSKQKLAVEKTGYGDSIRELKEQRRTAQFKADRTKNGMDTIFNTKQRDEVQQKIQTEVDSWKLANPEASALDQIKASSKIAAKHYTDSPLEIGNMAVESAVALINPYTLAASAISQGTNFYVNQTKKYNEAEGRTATGLVSGKEHAAIATGAAAYTALNFYADRVLQKAVFPSANSAFQRAEAAALEAAAKGATEAAALRTAANALRPTVKGTVARGLLAAGQEYPVEGLSSMMEEQWGHGRNTGDWTPFGVGGTAGLLAGGAMTAPSTLAGVGGAVVGNVAASQADAATNPENKRYNPTTDMAQAYGDVLNSPNATPEQISAARTKAKDILSSTQSRLSEMTQIQEAVASGDVDGYFATVLEKDIDDLNSQVKAGKLTGDEAFAKVDELEARYKLLVEKVSEYKGKSKKLDSEVNKLRKDLVASTKYHSKMSENINLAPDTIQSIKERQAIIEDDTASLEDLERATQDIIAYPMVATVSQLQRAMSLPNLTPEAYESLRVLTEFQIKHKGESLGKVRRHITEGSTGYRGLPEYIQGLTQALIDGDTNSVNGLMYDIGAFAQSHEKKAEAIADVIQNVPAGSEWQIARDKQNQWYVIKDEAKFLTGDKASGAYTIHKGSTKLLTEIQQEVQMIKDTQAAMQATMDLREQMQVEPADMSTYNRIKYAGQSPLTHATTMEEVAKFEAMLDQSNQVVAFDAEGNPHNVTVTALHPHDASKVVVTIEGESKKFAATRDRLAVLDSAGNMLYDVRNQEDDPTTSTTVTGSETETDIEVDEQADEDSDETEPTAATDTVPNVIEDINVSEYVKDHLRLYRGISDNLGATERIEELAAEGLTAAQIYNRLKDNLLANLDKQEGMVLVRAVRTSLGIPSRNAGEEEQAYQEWLKEYKQRKGTSQDEDSDEPETSVKGAVSHLDNYPEQANKPLDQWDHNDFSSVGMAQRYTGGIGSRLSLKEESEANRLIAKMIPKIIKRGVEKGKSTSDIMQEVYELMDKDYAMSQSGVASLEALIERERTAVEQSKGSLSEPETPEDTADDIGKKTMQALAKAQLEANPKHHSVDGIVNGQFAGTQGLNINNQGNVVLTRLASSESHLTKDWVAVDTKEMESTSLSNGGGRGLPTSGFNNWQDQYGVSRTSLTATFEIAPDELIQAIRDGNAYIGNMGEGEIVLNPAYARNYLKQVNGKDVRVLDNGYLQYTDGTMVETFDKGDVDANGLPMSISFGDTAPTQEALVERPEYISREDVQSNPDKLFLFGDNDKREGFGGQAKAMRGEPNAMGIRTKAAPSMNEGSFWSDAAYEENIRKIDEDFKAAFEFEGTVVIPKAGLGTGLSKLDTLAPKTLAHIEMRIAELEAGKPMSEVEVEAQSNEESDSDPRADVAGTDTKEQLNELANALDDRNFGEELYNEVNGSQNSTQDVTEADASKLILHSGGALGADTAWDSIGKEFGLLEENSKHYYTGEKSNHNVPNGTARISESDFNEGAKKVAKAAKANWGYPYASMKDVRLIRNWAQVKYADAVFAIGKIAQVGEKVFPNQKNDTRTAVRPSVTGGTGYAVGMAINEGKPVYVFDQVKGQWFTWDSKQETFVPFEGTPTLTTNFAGIGTRNLTESGKQAIRQVYQKTLEGNPENSVKPRVILPIGTSGSGKSTWIKTLTKSLPQGQFVVISPDEMRVEFTGNMDDKSKDAEIYEEVNRRTVQALNEGKQVIIDSTNLQKQRRRDFTEAVQSALPEIPIEYKLLPLDPELAKQRIKADIAAGVNRANVPDSTIDRHAKLYAEMLEDIKDEPLTPYTDTGGTNVPPQDETPVEEQTEAAETTPQYPRTVTAKFEVDGLDESVKGDITFNGDGTATVTVGKKTLSIEVTPENEKSFKQLGKAINLADPSIELGDAQLLTAEEQAKIRAEIYGEDADKAMAEDDPTEEINSRTDGELDEVNVENAEGLLDALKDPSSELGKRFKQVGSQVFAKPFIAVKDFFTSLDWNTPRIFDYLKQFLATATNSITEDDVNTMHALRNFHQGMKGNNFSQLIKTQVSTMLKVTDPKLLTTEHNLFSQMISYDSEGNPVVEENVLGAMSVAAYDYIIKNADFHVNSDKGVNFMLGVTSDQFIRGEDSKKYRRLTTRREKLIQELGDSAVRALGIKTKKEFTEDEALKLGASMGAVIYHAMKQRYLNEKFYYRHSILADVHKHMGYSTAKKMYEDWMEQKYDKGQYLPYPKYLKALRQFNRIITNPNSELQYRDSDGKVLQLHEFIGRLQSGKDDKMIPSITEANLIVDPKSRNAINVRTELLGLVKELRDARTEMNTPTYFVGIVQDQAAINYNEDPRNREQIKRAGGKKRDEQSTVVKTAIRNVSKRSDTLHKVFGLDRGKIDPLAAPVKFTQQDIKKSKGKVSTEQARILNKLQQEPLIVKSFTRSVSWLNKNYTNMLHDLIGAKPALDTLYVDKRVNAEAAARNLIKELDQAVEYVDTITNEDGTWNKFYHELVVWSNNRFGYASNVFNLQTSKIARSMSTYEKNVATLTKTVDGTSESDIFDSDRNLTEYGKLLHGVAIYAEKSTDKKKVIYDEDYMGDTTVDKAPNEVLLPELHKRLRENFQPHFDAIRKMIVQEELTDSDQVLIKELVGEMGSGIQSLEAAVELVAFWDTKKGETFQSHLTVESDGITNGMLINQIQNGTATIDMLVEGGLLTTNEMRDNPNASFFTLKRDGRKGEALKDYYTRAGRLQKEAWEFIESKLNLSSFDATMPDEQNLVQAIAFIDKTFGERKGAKPFATADNYAAGLDRIKEIVADHFVDNLFSAVEDFGKADDAVGLAKLLEATNTIIRFHNKYLAEIDGLESKWNNQKKRFEVQYSGTEKVSSLLKRAMLTATSQYAEQDKYVIGSEGKLQAEHIIFNSSTAALNLASYGETVMELANLYSNDVAGQLGLKKDTKLPSFDGLLSTDGKTPEQIKADQAKYREHMNTYLLNVLHAQSSQFRSWQVPEVDINSLFYLAGSAQAAVNYRIWDDNQLNALRAVSNVTQGTATVFTLKRMNAEFYRVRDANIAMTRVAYNVYQVIWDTVARQILDRRIRKTGLPTDELNNETPLTSLLTVEDIKELERTMQKFLPTGTTAFSRKSKNRSTSGAVFLDKVAKLFTEAVHTQNIRFDKENKTVDNYLTGVYKQVEQSIGLKGNSTMTQSVDAYVSTNALDKVLGGNFHDSNGFNIANYQEGAQAQNTAFFDAMVEHSAQEGFADAVLIPLKAFLADRTVIKSGNVVERVVDAASKLGKEKVSGLLTIMLQAEIRKLALLMHVELVQQYGTEDGHVDVTPEQKAKIAESVKRIEEGKTSIQELADLISTPNDEVKVITPKNPLPSYATTLHPNIVGQASVDAADTEEANLGNPFVQSLLAQGTENLEVADVIKTVEDYLDANPSELSKYYKLVLSMLPNAVKAGTKVNIFNPHAIPAHVKGEKVLQMERHTQGWYTEKQINLVYSNYAALTPETFVHEMIHAALANFIRTELRKAKKESKDGKPNWEAVHPAVRDILNIRSQVKAAIEADPNLADIAKDFEAALRDIQEFVTYGMTNERFINVLKGIYIKQTAQHKDKSKFSLIGSLKSAFTAFIESATEMLLGKTAKFKGKGKDAKINALAALVTNFSANLQAASEASTDMDFDEILQHVQTNAQNTQQKIREMKPKDIFEKLHQGNLSTEFQNHLRTDVLPLISEISESIGSTEVGRMFNEQVDPQTIWDDAVMNGKVPYTSDLFSMGFPMSDQEAYAVEALEASLNAIIDYSYGSTVHREMDRMFNMARSKLKPRDFHDGDWMTASVNEKMAAREKWNKLFNLSENLDNEGRNRFLTRFMALTLGSEKFNQLLNKVDPVPEELEGASTVYEYVLNRFHRFIDWIAERAARTGNEPKIQGRIRILAHQLAEIDAKRKNHLMNQSSKNPFMNVDSIGSDVMDKVRLAIRSLVEAEMFRKSPLTPVKAASEFGSLLLKQNLEELPDQIMQLRANLHPNTLPGAIAEIQQEMGRPTSIRKKIMAMISLSSNVQKERETMRQHIQREITQMFDERGAYLQPEDWKALTNVILRSGISRLYFEEYEPNVIYELIRDKEARQQEIASIEAELRQDIDGGIKIHRTKQLARYMATGKVHILQAQNTLQISAGVGLKDSVQVPSWFDPEVKLLNRLVSLYNLNYQDQAEIQRVSEVLDREASRLDNGVEYLLRFHQKLAADSAMQFADNPLSQSQSYTPEIHNTNRDIQFVANKAEEQLYERLGYKVIDGSELSKAFYDVAKTKVKIMVNMHADNQRIVDGGLMLNTTDAKGTDIGVEDIQATTKQLARKLIRESRNPDYDPSKDTEIHGVPKLNAEGKVTGMRYAMLNKTRDDLLERNNHPADLMAEYAASNLDLMNVEKVNTPVLEALYQDYLDNYAARPQDFVELSSKSGDPELVRMYRMIPYKSREHLKSLFGDDPIMVNANVMTIAFGYRKYTPTDIFKKGEDERNIAEAAYAGVLNGIFGEERAATVSSHMIKGTMEIMRKVKDFYVIRNFFTLFNNTLSNNAILLAYDVSPFDMARDTKVALQAGLKYKKDYSLYIQYKVKLQLGIGNMGENRQKMAYYEDSLNRNPLKKFIEAGMMSSIVEDIEQTKDDYSYQAALEKKFAGVIDTIPKPIRDGVNFVMVNQGSPLHKMLSDATTMSDFAAKYVLYNYHTKKKGMSHEEALFESHEAFINYEVPSNKTLQFLNDIGLVMFTKYYLRIQRVIYILLRKHPASVLLQSYLLGSIAGMPTVFESFAPSIMHLPVAGSVFESFSAVGQPIPLQLIF